MTQSETPTTKIYVIPTDGPRLSGRHVCLGPYSNTIAGRELAGDIAGRYREEGIRCMVIESATVPELMTKPVVEPERGLMCWVLTTAGSDCSNGGISAAHRNAVLLDERLAKLTETMKNRGRVPVRLWPSSADSPPIRLGETAPGYLVARPATSPAGLLGPMASGAWIVSDDPRFAALTGSHRPIPLHDRFETQALYDALSSD
jgi:hypothetical protein